nr:MAG TPA: hypothetical protein [Caudoviricetes sp.]
MRTRGGDRPMFLSPSMFRRPVWMPHYRRVGWSYC